MTSLGHLVRGTLCSWEGDITRIRTLFLRPFRVLLPNACMHAQAHNGASEDHCSSNLTATVSQYFNDESELGDLEESALRSTLDNE